MAKTVEIGTDGLIRLVDTTSGSTAVMSLVASLSVTEWVTYSIQVATGTTNEAITFAGVTAGKALAVKSNVDVSVKVNGSSTAIPLGANGYILLIDTDGGITSATYTNASGSTATIDIAVAG